MGGVDVRIAADVVDRCLPAQPRGSRVPARRWAAAMADPGLFQLAVLRPPPIDPAANDRTSIPI